jgi:protease PrsW
MAQIFHITLLVLISILPALFLLWFFEKQDKGEKEPRKLKNKIFLWGIITTIIAAGLEINLESIIPKGTPSWLYLFLIAFVVTAFIEEGLKFWVVKKQAWSHEKFNEIMDGITYAVIAGLGFAVLENLLYVLQEGMVTGIVRAVFAVPAHALFSGIMGYYIGKAKFEKTPWDTRSTLWKGFGIAVLYHGLYDFFLMSESWMWVLVIPLMIFMAMQLKYLINKARFEDKVQKSKPSVFDFKRGLKIVSATLFVVVGVLSLAGTILAVSEESSTYRTIDILYSAIFALILFAIAYFIIRKKGIAKK